MHMICQQMPCDDPTLLLMGEVVKALPQQFSSLPLDRLATLLGDDHARILALPSGMRQALHGSRPRQFSFR